MKKAIRIQIENTAPRRGHYNYQGSKTTFDNRPKRLRTRAAQNQNWKREHGC